MAQRRKISTLKIWRTIVTLLLVAGVCWAFKAANSAKHKAVISAYQVKITNAADVQFLNEERVSQLAFKDKHYKVGTTLLDAVDVKGLEGKLLSNQWVESANVFVDHTHKLNIELQQRVPVVRLIFPNGHSLYMDTLLEEVPISEHYAHYCPVVNNVPELKNDSVSRDIKANILKVVMTIAADSFWNAQASEIVYKPGHRFEIIPVVGRHKVLLGDTVDLQNKLENVFIFYKEVVSKIGWDKYEIIDVRFKDQVYASPNLPWKAPADRAMATMNWVKTIVGQELQLKPAVTYDVATGTVNSAANVIPTVHVNEDGTSEVKVAHKDVERPIATANESIRPVVAADKPVVKDVAAPTSVVKPAAAGSTASAVKPVVKPTSASGPATKTPAPQSAVKPNSKTNVTTPKVSEQKQPIVETKAKDNTKKEAPSEDNKKEPTQPKYIYKGE